MHSVRYTEPFAYEGKETRLRFERFVTGPCVDIQMAQVCRCGCRSDQRVRSAAAQRSLVTDLETRTRQVREARGPRPAPCQSDFRQQTHSLSWHGTGRGSGGQYGQRSVRLAAPTS